MDRKTFSTTSFYTTTIGKFILSRRHHKVTLFLVYLFYFLLFEWNMKSIFLNNICNHRCKAICRLIELSIWKEYMIKYSDILSTLVISGMVAIFIDKRVGNQSNIITLFLWSIFLSKYDGNYDVVDYFILSYFSILANFSISVMHKAFL